MTRDDLRLSKREEQVIRLALKGLRYRSIGKALGITEQTVKNHVYAACKRNGMTKFQLAVTLTGGSFTEPVTPKNVLTSGSGCQLCDARIRIDEGYHEIKDPDALGGMRWVRCTRN